MIKVLHVTPGLESGGAEMLLSQLVGAMDRSRFENSVVSLTDEGPILGKKIRDKSVALHTLDFPRGLPNPMLIYKLADRIKREKPEIVHTWMYHANAVGTLSCLLAGRPTLVWGIHNAKLDPANMKRQTLRMIYLNKQMSWRFPTSITCSSDAARAVHADLGYPIAKLQTISNGIDTDEFVPNPTARVEIRRDLGIDQTTPIVGMIARYTKQKDHVTFFKAAGILHRRRPEVRFVLCGEGVSKDSPQLWTSVTEAGVQDVTHLLGLYPDTTSRLNNAFDVATSSSAFAESFCIALGEAMACGIPCVTTNMEGPAALVGDVGKVVPIADADAMARAWEEMIDLSPTARADIADRGRRRVTENFSLKSMVRKYEDLYEDLCSN